MKLHLPIGLRKALMAVFAALAVSPAMAAVITTDQSTTNGLTMSGDSNKIVSQDTAVEYYNWFYGWLPMESIDKIPGFIAGDTNPNVTVSSGDITMYTTNGYNAIVGSVSDDFNVEFWALLTTLRLDAHGGRPTVTASAGDVYMKGPANALMLGSTVTGKNITLENSQNNTISVGTVASGVLGGFADKVMPAALGDMQGIFNIVQGSNLHATNGSVTLNTATTDAVNNLKVNVITGGRGDISGIVANYIDQLAFDGASNLASGIINELKKQNDFGSTITATQDIAMGGGASVIIDTTLSDLAAFAQKETDLQGLLAGNKDNSTPVKLEAGENIKLNSIVNMVHGAQGGVTLTAGTAEDKVGSIIANGALNVVGGKTTLTADNINLTPGTSVSINKLVGELKQLGDFMPVDLSTITGKLGDLAKQDINAAVVAGGATLTANGTGDNGNISLSGTAGIVVNTKLTDVLGALDTLQAGHEMLFAQKVLESGTKTSLEASRDINMGAQLNVLHGGGFTADEKDSSKIAEGVNTLTITAGNDVKLQGAANLVSGNVQVNAGSRDAEGKITHKGDIHMHGEFLDGALATAVGSFANGFVKDMGINNAGVSNIIGQLTEKGNFNVVTGGATLEATGDIKLDSELDTEFKQASAINAVLDTQFTDVITAVINGEPSAILPTDKEGVIKPTTTLTAGGNIDLLGRVNVVNGLRGNVVVDADGDVSLQGNLSMVSGNSTVTGNNITINTVEGDTYKMHLNAQEVKDMLGVSDGIANAIQNMGMINAAVVAGGADLKATSGDITTGGTVGLLMNTPAADVLKEFMSLGKDDSMLDIAASLLQKGATTTLTAEKGNINVGSQFNLLHGGGFTDDEGGNALVLNATNLTYNEKGEAVTGLVNIEGTANVVSGNVKVNAGEITMTGEVLSNEGMKTAANGLIGSLTGDMDISGVSGVLNKLVNKGSVNMVTGGATLTATAVKNAEGEMVGGDITMTGKPVDDVGKIGNINAVIDTEIVDVLEAMGGNMGSLVQGGGKTTTLNADGNINLEGRVNLVNGTYVKVDAGKDVNLQGNLSMIGGATVNAGTLADAEAGIEEIKGDININTSEDKKYKMYIDSSDLGGMELPLDADTTAALANTGVNAAIVAGGAKLNATQDINIGGTAGLVVNTKVMDVLGALGHLQNGHELLFAKSLLESGTATKLEASRDINMGAQLNVLHGGNIEDDKSALTITAGRDVTLHGAANLVSGNVEVNANGKDADGNYGDIHMEGYPLNNQLAGAAAGFANGLLKDMGIDNAGVSGMIGKLAEKGSFNVVTGGATLNATGDIIMDAKSVDDVGKVGNINAVLDTQFTDVITAVINGEPNAILPTDKDVFKPTTTLKAGGNIDLLGRVNVVNGLRGNVVVDAGGDVNLQGNLSMVSGNASVTGKTININTDEAEKYKMYVDSSELSILPDFAILDKIGGAIEGVAMNAAVVAGGANLTSEGVDDKGNGITIGGTVGLLMNTPVADAIKEFNPLNPGKNPSELEIVESLLQKGTATSLTAKEGNILVGSQFNLVHGGGFTNVADENAFTLTAEKGNVNVEGTANVVSGNVKVNAKDITMTGEVLPADMAKAANGLVGSLTEEMGISGVSGVLNKLVNKGSVNMVTGGATLTAKAVENAEGEMVGGDITMTGKSVDDVGKIGNINAVIDTEMVDVLDAYINNNTDALVHGGGHMTTLKADGNINLEGRVNVVNGTYVTLDAGKDVNLQGNLSMIGGATVNADGNININTFTEDKYKMYLDAEELGALMPGGITLPDGLDGVVENTGVNAAVIAGGAKLEADGNITTGGTAGILVNTPMAEVGDRVMSLLTNPNHLDETWMVYELLQKGIATTVTSTNGSILLGSQLNVLHGGNMGNADAALKLSAANGAIKLNGTLNMVSGNVTMDAESINMTGEALKYNLGDGLAGMPGAEVLDKLNTYGSANVVLGGATLKATGEEGITMKGLANAVLDVELVDGVEAFMDRPDMSSLMQGGAYETTLYATTGDINLLGRFNVVNGGKVSLIADEGDVNVNGGVSFIGGGATVTANNIKLNDDETGKYQMYFDSEELGAILPAGSPITEMLNTFGITDLLGNTGVNGAIVAGGANLQASSDITTGGTVSMLVNTPLSGVLEELGNLAEHKQETWMVYQLLQKGTATTVNADGNINLASRLNVLHGGNFGKDGANALSLTAGKDVKMNGSANVVSGNVIVNAGSRDAEGNITHKGDILMKGEPLKFDMESGVEMLDKLAAKGSTNIVTGGATLKATGNIKLDSMANFVLDTEATDLVEVFMERKPDAVAQGGNKLTSLNADGNIDLVGRLNVVNGAYVALNAGKDVNINGTLNMVSGKAKVNAEGSINITGQTSVGLDWGEIIPGVVGDYVDGTGLTDKLNKGVNGSMILGGSTLTATNDIKMSGMAGVVTNVPLGSAFEALSTKLEQTWQPELWLMKDMLNGGIATSLTAGNNIELTSRLNLLHGGNMGNADAALKLTAGKEVIIAGTANIISGNTQVIAGEGITVTGKTGVGFDWDKVVAAMPEKYAGYGALAGQMGILAKLEKGVNGSVIAGGATLTAKNGDITMEGMATAVVDVTAENVLTAVETMNGTPIMEGGTHTTTITAEQGNINLNSRLNLVNGGKVTLEATKGSVNMNGTFNTVSGNANVKAGDDIVMNAQNKVGVDISPVLDGHYAEIAKDLGMADVLKNGVSSNIVAGGANLEASDNVVMSGVATAIVDTTASNVIGAVKGDNLGELMKGGRDKTEVKAGKDIVLASQMNLVNGGNTENAGGVSLEAGNDVLVGGQISVVNRAEIKAGNEVNFNSGNTVVKYSVIDADKVAFKGETAEITDVTFNNASVDVRGTQLVNTLGSDVLDIGHLNVAEMGSIENLGSLTVQEATLSGATLYNAGSIIVSNKMTLESATLSFVVDNLTLNSSAIVLGDGGSFYDNGCSTGAVDMIAGLHLELNYDQLSFKDDSNVFNFEVAIFKGITETETDWLDAALADGELSITLTNGYLVEVNDNLSIKWDNNVAYVTGTASVPEPTTATLSLLALAALAARRRRK